MSNTIFVTTSNMNNNHLFFFKTEEEVTGHLKKEKDQVIVDNERRYNQQHNTRNPNFNLKATVQQASNQWVMHQYVVELDPKVIFGDNKGIALPELLRAFIEYRHQNGTRNYSSIYRGNNISYGMSAEVAAERRAHIKSLEGMVIDVTDLFIESEVEEVEVRQELTATVIKKGLKSTGKKVSISDSRFQNATDLKGVMGSMERIGVHLQGWGNINMSPSSLSEINVTPVMKKQTTFKIL